MSDRLAKKLMIVGWDAADWVFIDRMFAAKELPNLKRLVERGVRANLSTLDPKLSPLLWTSIATGKTADKHGILNFIEPNPNAGGVRVSSSTSRKTKALWNILTQSGLRTNVVSWYASHPAEPISGVCVSNLFQEGAPASVREPWPMSIGTVHPPDCAARIAKQRVHPAGVVESMLRQLVPRLDRVGASDSRLATLRKLVAQCHSVHRAALAVLANDRHWDCTMIYYDSIDTFGHHFMEFHPPRMAHISEPDFSLFQEVMVGVYRLQDAMLGELLTAAGREVTVIVLSDHGFHSDHQRPKPVDIHSGERAAVEAAWHRPFGMLVMAGPGIKADAPESPSLSASLLDIAPTALTLLGLPVGRDMDGRVLTSAFDRTIAIEHIDSWDSAGGEAGMHPTEMRMDPFESHDAVQQLIDLGYLTEMPADAQALVELTRQETRFNCGVVYMTTGRASQAIPIFEDLVRQKPTDSRYVMALAQCLFFASRWSDCDAVLREFLKRRPDQIEARLILAAALGSAGKNSETISELQRVERDVSAMNDARSSTLALLGDAYSIVHQWVDAERSYRRGLAVDPANPHVLHGLARAVLAQKQFDQAVDYCLSALEVKQVYPEAHHLLGVALTWLGDFPHAIQSFQIAVSMQPGLIDTHRFLAMVYRHLNDLSAASKHLAIVDQLRSKQDSSVVIPESVMGPDAWEASLKSKVTPNAGRP